MHIVSPYLLFIGDATDQLSIKMARGAADWRPELCIGEYSVAGCTVTTGIEKMSIDHLVLYDKHWRLPAHLHWQESLSRIQLARVC